MPKILSPKSLWRWLVPVVLLALNAPALAQVDTGVAESLMQKSGLWQQLASVAPQANAGIQAAVTPPNGNATATELARLSALVDAVYGPDRLRASVRKVMARQLKAGHTPALLKWYDSPLGTRISRLEEAASNDPADPGQQLQQAAALLRTLPAPRRRLIEQLVTATRCAESMTSMSINGIIATQRGVALAHPEVPGPGVAQLRQMLEAQRPQMLQAFTAMSQALFSRAYAPLTDRELLAYTEFQRSPAGVQFMDASIQAVDAAMTEAAESIGSGVPGTRDGHNI